MKKNASKPLVLAAYPRGEHLDLFTILEERRQLNTRDWQRLPPPMTSTRKILSDQIGADTGKFQTVLLCVDSSRCLLQSIALPTTDSREIDSMTTTALSFFPVLTQPEFVSSHAILTQDATHSLVLSVTFRRDELLPLLEKIEQWGADLPVVVPDSWVLWKSLSREFELPDQYAWVWMDPTPEAKTISLKMFLVQHGQIRFVFQPFLPRLPENSLGGPVSEAIQMALECAAREQHGMPEPAPFYFSSYHLDLTVLLPRLSVGKRPIQPLSLAHPVQEAAATLRQQEPAGFKNWLPGFWERHQAGRAKSRTRKRILKIGGLVYVLFLLCLAGLSLWQRWAAAAEERTMASQKPEYERAMALKKQVARMRAQAEGDQGALDVLFLATSAMPRELTLTGYSFKYQDGLSLRGFASANSAVYDFVEALKKQKPFRSVELNSVRNNPQKNWVEFDIQCKMGAPGAPAGKRI